jgi:hypothetical protein
MSKTNRSRLGKKKQIRNILICAAVAAVIALAIFLYIALQKDGAGMNCFQRNATAASANGVKVTMGEYRIAYDSGVSNAQTTTYSDAEIRTIQENAAKSVLMQKVYLDQAKKLGLSLTDEQKAKCRESAQAQIDAIEEYFEQELIKHGNYSKSTMETQMSDYYRKLGMSKNEYFDLLKNSAEAEYCRQAIETYYKENDDQIDEAELIAFYRKSVEESMYTTDANGEKTPLYQDGLFWTYLSLYSAGYSTPLLYVPDGFIYVDFVMMHKDSIEDAQAVINKINSGELSFDDLMASEENEDPYKAALKGPYPIAENDHAGLFTDQEAYDVAASLEMGEIKPFIVNSATEDNPSAVTVYLFRRAEGKMCMDGETGVIDIDYFPGIRESAKSEYRLDQWLGEIKYEDAMYAYKGALG